MISGTCWHFITNALLAVTWREAQIITPLYSQAAWPPHFWERCGELQGKSRGLLSTRQARNAPSPCCSGTCSISHRGFALSGPSLKAFYPQHTTMSRGEHPSEWGLVESYEGLCRAVVQNQQWQATWKIKGQNHPSIYTQLLFVTEPSLWCSVITCKPSSAELSSEMGACCKTCLPEIFGRQGSDVGKEHCVLEEMLALSCPRM